MTTLRRGALHEAKAALDRVVWDLRLQAHPNPLHRKPLDEGWGVRALADLETAYRVLDDELSENPRSLFRQLAKELDRATKPEA